MRNAMIGRRWFTRAMPGGAAAPGWLATALAQGTGAGGLLRVGMAAPNTTLDPHLQSNAPNNAVTSHIFDALVTNDAASRSTPGLAESWRRADDTHWEFTLRRDARFTDGAPSRPRTRSLPSAAPPSCPARPPSVPTRAASRRCRRGGRTRC